LFFYAKVHSVELSLHSLHFLLNFTVFLIFLEHFANKLWDFLILQWNKLSGTTFLVIFTVSQLQKFWIELVVHLLNLSLILRELFLDCVYLKDDLIDQFWTLVFVGQTCIKARVQPLKWVLQIHVVVSSLWSFHTCQIWQLNMQILHFLFALFAEFQVTFSQFCNLSFQPLGLSFKQINWLLLLSKCIVSLAKNISQRFPNFAILIIQQFLYFIHKTTFYLLPYLFF
jgi:hypothetical protein